MKRGTAVFLALALLLGLCSAAAEVDVGYWGSTYRVTLQNLTVGKMLLVEILCEGDQLPRSPAGNVVTIVSAAAVFEDGAEERSTLVLQEPVDSGTVRYTFFFLGRTELPKAVLVYPEEDRENALPLWQEGEDIPGQAAPAEEGTGDPA